MVYEQANSYQDLKDFYETNLGSCMAHYIEQRGSAIFFAVIMCMRPADKNLIKYFSVNTDGFDYEDFSTNYIDTQKTFLCTNSEMAESHLVSQTEIYGQIVSISNNTEYVSYNGIIASEIQGEISFGKKFCEIAITNVGYEALHIKLNSLSNDAIVLGKLGEVDNSISIDIDVEKIYYFTMSGETVFNIILAC